MYIFEALLPNSPTEMTMFSNQEELCLFLPFGTGKCR